MKVNDMQYCDKCESLIPQDSSSNPDRALELRLDGGYGMFMDLTHIDLLFCHSCAVEFFRSIPFLTNDKINGMHSVSWKSSDYPLCCEYSWTISESNKVDEHGHRITEFGTKEHFDNRKKS